MGFNSEFKGFIEKCTCVLAYLNLRKINVLDIFFFFYQLDAQILYFNTFITFLYMFRALLSSSSGGQLY